MAKVKKTKEKKAKSKKDNCISNRIVDLVDFEEPLIVEIYGRSGTGKTALLSTFPKPMLILDVKDHGSESAKSSSLERGDIHVLSIECPGDMDEAHEFLLNNPGKYKTVGIDTLTGLQEMVLSDIKEKENKAQPSQRIFGLVGEQIKSWILAFKELSTEGITPVFLCQDRMDNPDTEAEDQLNPEIGPALQPGVAKFLNAAVKVIGHTYIQTRTEKVDNGKKIVKEETVEYRLRLGPNPFYLTKIRQPKGSPLPEFLVNPSYKDIKAITLGEYEPQKETKTKKVKKDKKIGKKRLQN